MKEEVLQRFPELESCALRVHVPVFREVVLKGNGGIDSLTRAASRGFDVFYNVAHDQECDGCKGSNGVCGTKDNVAASAEDRFSCFCQDGFEGSLCYGHSANHTGIYATSFLLSSIFDFVA